MIIKKLQQLKAKKGFTLVELLVVIAIIGILAAVLIPLMSAFLNNARISNAESTANQLATAIQTPLSAIMGRQSESGKPQIDASATPPGYLGIFSAHFDSGYTPTGLPNGSWRVNVVGTPTGSWTNGVALIEDALNDSFPADNVGVFLIRVGRRPTSWEADAYVTVAFRPGATAAADITTHVTAAGNGTVVNRNDPHFGTSIINGRLQGVQGRPIVGCFPPQ